MTPYCGGRAAFYGIDGGGYLMASEEEVPIGDDLALMFENTSSKETAERIATEIGFNTNPWFGANRKKSRIEAELAMLNLSLITYSIYLSFNEAEAKKVVDEFSTQSKMYVLMKLVERSQRFMKKQPDRQARYYKDILNNQPNLALSSSFITHLGLNVRTNPDGQVFLMEHIYDVFMTALSIIQPDRNLQPVHRLSTKLGNGIQIARKTHERSKKRLDDKGKNKSKSSIGEYLFFIIHTLHVMTRKAVAMTLVLIVIFGPPTIIGLLIAELIPWNWKRLPIIISIILSVPWLIIIYITPIEKTLEKMAKRILHREDRGYDNFL
jgi:hypothetical protein